jgi:hypothetical protein
MSHPYSLYGRGKDSFTAFRQVAELSPFWNPSCFLESLEEARFTIFVKMPEAISLSKLTAKLLADWKLILATDV